MKYKKIVIAFIFCFGCWGSVFGGEEVWKTSVPAYAQALDLSITQTFAKKFNATLSSHQAPFARRIRQLKDGDIDLMSGLLKNKDREKFAHFIEPPYKQKSNKYFFVRKGEGKHLQKYENLY